MTQQNSIDDLIFQDSIKNSQPVESGNQPDPVVVEPITKEVPIDNKLVEEPEPSNDPYLPDEVDDQKQSIPEAANTDEYGNPTKKQKLYTEEEVNQRIRERLSRGRFAKEQQEEPIQSPAQNNVQTEDSAEEWVKNVVKQTIQQQQQEMAHEQWKQKEIIKQQEFEDKFASGMSKYNDFKEVVGSKPITDTMLVATRSLENPAAFVYAASKMHPEELDRIARIDDNYAQAAEIGRLHERMVKEKKKLSTASKPLESPKGDLGQSNAAPRIPSVDERIIQDAKRIQRR